MNEGYFVDDRHAQYAGWVLGIALKNGVPVTNVVDEHGNHTDRLQLELHDPKQRPTKLMVTLVVPPPPDDWVSG
jgi:hypothetical protein